MQLADRHIIKSTENRLVEIDGLAFRAKNLYNAANYVIRQSFVYSSRQIINKLYDYRYIRLVSLGLFSNFIFDIPSNK